MFLSSLNAKELKEVIGAVIGFSSGLETKFKSETSEVAFGAIKKDLKKLSRNQKKFSFEEIDLYFAKELLKKMKANNSQLKEPNLESWANEFRLIRVVDKRTIKQISYLIRWTQENTFWKTNILSPNKLRQKWDKLVLQVKSEKKEDKVETILKVKMHPDLKD